MIWDELTRKAFDIACCSHVGQVDKGGIPYIFHPLHVASKMPTSELTAVALLHDVCEDAGVSSQELLDAGMPEDVVHAVALLTHDKEVPYLDYIRGVVGDALAAPVKKADLMHNSEASRLPKVLTAKDISRLKKYKKALEILKDVPDYT